MSNIPGGGFEIAYNNGYLFSNAQVNDFIIHTVTPDQRLLLGAASNGSAALVITSNAVNVAGFLDVSGGIYQNGNVVPFSRWSSNNTGSNIYRMDGRVAIGSNTHPELFSVQNGNAFFGSNIAVQNQVLVGAGAATLASSNAGLAVDGNITTSRPVAMNGVFIKRNPGAATTTSLSTALPNVETTASNMTLTIRGSTAASAFAFRTGGSNTVAVLTGTGTLGVGLSNPSAATRLHVKGDARIEGNLTVNGISTIINTDVSTTERLDITNDGTGPALRVTQLGPQPIADFYDDSNVLALRIADGGAVGVGTSNPTQKLDVAGGIAFTGGLYKSGMALGLWNQANVSMSGAVGWGDNTYGQITIPTEAQTGITQVSAGMYYSLALTTAGKVLAWGAADFGTLTVPADALSGVSAIAAGNYHALALKNGGVIGWGDNGNGNVSIPASATSGVTAIAASLHSVALKSDGTVVAWGRNDAGQTSIPDAAQSNIIAIANGDFHSLALKNTGAVVSWGRNAYGEGTVPSTALSNVTAISAGLFHSIALKSNGSVIAWGRNNMNQLNVPAGALSNVIAISAADDYSYALRSDGTVIKWGGFAGTSVFSQSNITAIKAGFNHLMAVQATSQSATYYGDTNARVGIGLSNPATALHVAGAVTVGGAVTATQGFTGNASTATALQTARTINGVSFDGSANIAILASNPYALSNGAYITGSNFNGSVAVTWAVNATNNNTASTVVARDASGNFNAGTITANLNASSISTSNLTASGSIYSPGGIVNTVITSYTVPAGHISTTSSTLQATTLTVSIQPKFATSKILIHFSAYMAFMLGDNGGRVHIFRSINGAAFTQITSGYGAYYQPGGTPNAFTPLSFVYDDSPSSTLPITYKIYISSDANSANYTFGFHSTSRIVMIAQELGQ